MRRAAAVVAVTLLASACSTPSTPSTSRGGPTQGAPATKAVAATLSVTAAALADDCGHGAAPSPATAPAPAAAPAPEEQELAEGAKSDRDGKWSGMPCEQSSVQLLLGASAAGAPGPVVIGAIELLDQGGKRLGSMVARAPQVWSGDAYGPWDGTLRPGDSLRLSVPSSAPPWDQLPGGRYSSQMFQVRVTVTVGGTPYTATSTASVAPAPMVET